MGRKGCHRRTELRYEFDRLLQQRMEQVYDILLTKVLEDFARSRKPLADEVTKR